MESNYLLILALLLGCLATTVVAIGGFMIPALIQNDYDERFSVGIMTTAPILGIIIPPSISMILYAMVSNDPLEALFLTGFLPGVLIIVAMSVYAYFVCKKQGLKTLARPPAKSCGGSSRRAAGHCACRC